MPLRLARCELADAAFKAALEYLDKDPFFHRYHGTKSLADVRKAQDAVYDFSLEVVQHKFPPPVYLKVL
ncbi:hypothetical protein N7G274_004584 [Stereocaulon virgatum]|uniref:HEPN domain-containing protein n=1 Tax=Stereocaulon virgatum TaxID=373712 RepID=A0ABR4AAB4_9LECA